MSHLIQISDLDQQAILKLINRAKAFQQQLLSNNVEQVLAGKLVFNIFFEGSTRTRMAFEVATKLLGGYAFNLDVVSSSVKKGESLNDTIYTLSEMYMDAMVVRHGANGTPSDIAAILPPHIGLINAGDGTNAHPTQALLDVMTMLEVCENLEQLRNQKIVIIGDIQHSRVAKSLLTIFAKLQIMQVKICGPKGLLPEPDTIRKLHPQVEIVDTIEAGLADVNFAIALRMQKERLGDKYQLDQDAIVRDWALDKEKLKLANPQHWIMHPGPIIRGIDILDEVADAENSLIRRQVHNGISIRMAALEMVINS